ncbi:DUF2785 domain-containing protein [Alicyclobacillus fastidiosus]|uniref:DUF2785 domain-containing protein n=1 Tax=Alicyclobacillus fastidiosus TaxID=392011 RepID=A0ABV5AKD7_9BACL|nr:DUF2785 domain-containing protein [Alicyclobacillus fastidiosus]WEH08442.1 DUF2785 domain-containing protein [Alicyclobacillus fastidiosus]
MHESLFAKNKDFLRCLVDTNFSDSTIEISNVFDLSLQLMDNLHSIDSELRDHLSYTILERIIAMQKLLDTELYRLLDLSLSEEYLLRGLGETNTDTVFTRTFSILIVAAIMQADYERRFLTAERVHRATRVVLYYASAEQDRRGFVEGKGWAHSVAHTSDALDACAQHPLTTVETQKAILVAVTELASLDTPLPYLEDDRLAFTALRLILNGQLSLQDLQSWVQTFDIEQDTSHKTTLKHSNVQHFLRSLYNLLLWEEAEHPLLPIISEQLKRLNIFYRYSML